MLAEIRRLAQERVDAESGETLVKKEDWPQYHVHISSVNTFPTGAGLASSAAGLACLVSALAALYCVKEEYDGQLTAIARQGSGSASRSMFGGFVKWLKGSKPDGTDSIAVQIADENYWPELRAVVLVVSEKEKDTSSTSGMETSRLTSPLLQHRAAEVVEPRLKEIEEAYLKRDFETFGRITMQDSNQFHAVCLDTYPPIFYMNDVSKSIIKLIHAYNAYHNEVRAAYTFDAGPNAVIYTLDKYVDDLLSMVAAFYPAPGAVENYTNAPERLSSVAQPSEELMSKYRSTGRTPVANDVKYVFVTKAGPGPQRQPLNESLLDPATGQPVEPGPNHKRMQIGSA